MRRILLKIGELLIANKVITKDQLLNAIIHQTRTGKKLGEALVALKYCTYQEIARALCKQLRLPYVDLETRDIPHSLFYTIPHQLMVKYRFIPFACRKQLTRRPLLSIAMADPNNILALDELRLQTQCELKVYITEEYKIDSLLHRISTLPPLEFETTYTMENIARQMLVLNAITAYLAVHKQFTIAKNEKVRTMGSSQEEFLSHWPVIEEKDLKRIAKECFDLLELTRLPQKGPISTTYELKKLAYFKVHLKSLQPPKKQNSDKPAFSKMQMTIIKMGPAPNR